MEEELVMPMEISFKVFNKFAFRSSSETGFIYPTTEWQRNELNLTVAPNKLSTVDAESM